MKALRGSPARRLVTGDVPVPCADPGTGRHADGKTVCTYGPWVGDAGHGRRPEIHPAEIIWWREPVEGGSEYTVLLVHDDSNRFDRPHWGEWYFRGACSPRWRGGRRCRSRPAPPSSTDRRRAAWPSLVGSLPCSSNLTSMVI